MNGWNEAAHHRDGQGQFTRTGVGRWAKKVAEQWGDSFGRDSSLIHSQEEGHPAGHADAAARLEHLWDVPDRKRGIERTDAEQAELEGLEDAFGAYRDELGLTHSDRDEWNIYRDRDGVAYDQYGTFLAARGESVNRPESMRQGFKRVGDHPQGRGSINGVDQGSRNALSGHPSAGGVWLDPKRPGTRHKPRLLDDFGHLVSDMQPKPRPSEMRKDAITERRRGDLRGRPAEGEAFFSTGFKDTGYIRQGAFGYAARDAGGSEASAVFVARMKRIQPRARQETAREAVRRTPRGTRIENWMQA